LKEIEFEFILEIRVGKVGVKGRPQRGRKNEINRALYHNNIMLVGGERRIGVEEHASLTNVIPTYGE